jgi:hypothetical protein
MRAERDLHVQALTEHCRAFGDHLAAAREAHVGIDREKRTLERLNALVAAQGERAVNLSVIRREAIGVVPPKRTDLSRAAATLDHLLHKLASGHPISLAGSMNPQIGPGPGGAVTPPPQKRRIGDEQLQEETAAA